MNTTFISSYIENKRLVDFVIDLESRYLRYSENALYIFKLKQIVNTQILQGLYKFTMSEILKPSKNPLKDAVAMVTRNRIERMSGLRVAKSFACIGYPFIGFEGHDDDEDGDSTYFQLRVDYDPEKLGHVNVMVDNKKYAFLGEQRAKELEKKEKVDISKNHYDFTQQWAIDVINNMNGAQYCNGMPINGVWGNNGREKDPECIKGMKKFMLAHC